MNEVNKPAKTLVGQVVSDKMNKTIVVLVERKIQHPKYNKYIKRTYKVHAHDEDQKAKMGDLVKCKSVRPYSKTKFWELVDVVAS